MIADFSKHAGVAVGEAGMWNVRAQNYESPRSLVERVCNFLEQYPLSRTGTTEVAPSVTLGRARDVRRSQDKSKIADRATDRRPA